MFNVLPKVPSNKDNIIRTAKKTHQNDLILSGHYLSHIPWSIFQDPLPRNLIFLDLSNNNLSFLPNEIGSLTNLEKFYVSGNFLTELPAAIKRLVKLKGIDLSRNSIKCLPEEVNALKHLEWINLSGNKLRIIPVYLLCLPKLVKVHCLRNPELENVPKSIAREGLHAMREYLQVNVEKYESIDRAEKKKDRLKTSAVLDEIFDKWNFTEDHKCQKKTKDASTTSDMGTDDLDFSTFNNPNDGASSRGNCNTCAATQTEPEDFDSAVVPQKTVNFPYLRLNSDFTSLGHEWWRRRRKYGDADSSQGKSIKDYNDLMGELVRCFHEQLDLVNDYKISMLLNRERRNIVSVNCAESLPIYSSTPVKDRGVIKCKSCGLKKTGLSTSDYGTMSVDNTIDLYDEYDEDYNESCGGNSRGSLCEELSWSDDVSEAICDGDSDTEEEILWPSPARRYVNACRELVMEELDVSISVPELILSGHCQSEFTMDIIEDTSYIPYLPFNATLASPVIHAGPHGAKFYSTVPATLKLPLGVVLEKEDELKCFVSDTDIDELPVWEEIEQEMVSIQGDYVVIKSTHFSLFCATAIKPYPKTERIISPEGGELLLEEIPELKVKFPNSAVDADIKASVTSLYYDPMYVLDTSDSDAKAIAAPVVSLGPSGTAFLDNVQITLPLPNAREVFQQFGNPGLTILCSHTDEGQRPNWEQLETTYTINEAQHVYTVTFNVHHFTMFQILWNILDAALPESIKLHASSHVPHFSFWVYFQTLMTECHHNRQFGLCVICYRFGNPVQGLAQYPIEVGTCKPKKVKTGEIIIQLRSGMFRADTNAGESEDLIKKEYFTGHDFEKQFALIFNDRVPDYGLFGQIAVSRKNDENDLMQELFSFNLVKSSKRAKSTTRLPSEWESKLYKEVASLLSIDDHHWQELALTLGYTRDEIRHKFRGAEDPLHEMLGDYMDRGGEAESFLNAMYRVARTFKLIPLDQMMENRENRQLENKTKASTSRQDNSDKFCSCPPTPSRSKSVKRKLIDSYVSDEQLTDSRIDDVAGEIAKSWKSVGRKLELSEPELREIELNYQNAGEKEKAFQMLITWRERDPESCTMQKLSDILCKSGLRYTAQRCLYD